VSKCKIKRSVYYYESVNKKRGIIDGGYFTKKDIFSPKWRFIKMNVARSKPFKTKIFNLYFLELYPCLEYQTNRLVKTTEKKRFNIPLVKGDIPIILEVSSVTAWRFLQEADKLNIIKYDKDDKCFYVNPDIVINGSEVSAGVWDLFNGKKELDEMETGINE